ncbi:CRISPR-associated protein Cst2 [Sinosporangium album]|uniref:CRISPR-associated protein Cst2 n=1 Tax=Sinosporangium album TaxID=504805 RepID=A0A1G7VRN0_9ACTN|nr:type I-B CRISPR-associated protein Cas7/Cst2/DevR [Sinosporangium album]SDG62465.1 CRISPR-associated protein Cst2 [Sinosporangium album]
MSYLVGKIVLDVVAGAPNNGLSEDNVARVKQMRIGRAVHPYISAQAVRRWLRDSLPASEPVSPVVRSGTGQKQQAYTHGRPDRYIDDDLFGYMVAVKGDKAKTCQRDTVFATGTFVSVAPRRPERDFGTMSRGFGAGENPVIHGHEFYSAELAADVLLDMPRIGVFEIDGTGLKVALPGPTAAEVEADGAEPVVFRGSSALRLDMEERRRRAALLLHTLTAVRGGAKRSMHYGDRTPALILLAPVKGGINPFTRILGVRNDQTQFDADVLRAEIEAWGDELDGPVLLGWSPGFLGAQREKAETALADLVSAGRLLIGHPRTLLGRLANDIEDGARDSWFEDAKE